LETVPPRVVQPLQPGNQQYQSTANVNWRKQNKSRKFDAGPWAATLQQPWVTCLCTV